jgi:hypothetical protein
MVDLLVDEAFADLDTTVHFAQLSQSRMGYGVDTSLADLLVDELRQRGLARPSEDGVSIPLHPVVRTSILVILGQLARGVGQERGDVIHPTTSDSRAMVDLLATLKRPTLPSASHVVAPDLEAVTLDLSRVPLNEVLAFRAQYGRDHRSYINRLRAFMVDLAQIDESEREALTIGRRQELADTAHDLQRNTRRSFARNLATWSLGIAGSVWSARAGDPLGLALAAGGLAAGLLVDSEPQPSAYSYVFRAERQLL